MNYFETLLSSGILGKLLSTSKHRHTSTSCKGVMGMRAGEEVDSKERLGNTLCIVYRLKLSSQECCLMQAFSAARFITEEPGTKQTSVHFHHGSGGYRDCLHSESPASCDSCMKGLWFQELFSFSRLNHFYNVTPTHLHTLSFCFLT